MKDLIDPAVLLTHSTLLPAESFDWGAIKWLCNGTLQPGALQTLGICHLFPGKQNPAHYHPNCEELLYVLAGKGRHRLGQEWLDLDAGATLRIPAGIHHQLVNVGWEPLTCIIAFSSGDRQTVFLD
jgi:quercetin dioxygenase-like cupin family protein